MASNSLRGPALLWIFLILVTCSGGVKVKADNNRHFKIVKEKKARMLSLIGQGTTILNASTLSECATRCKQRTSKCFSFTYNNETDICQIGSWAASNGNMYSDDCHKPFRHQSIGDPNGKLYTSACCQGDFILRTRFITKPKCLYFPNINLNFSGARTDCESRDSQMVTFSTEEDMDMVKTVLSCNGNTWVGIRDNCNDPTVNCKTDRGFFWPDGTELNGDLKAKVTAGFDNQSDKEVCVHLVDESVKTKTFDDAPCGEEFYYVCEKDPFSSDTQIGLHC